MGKSPKAPSGTSDRVLTNRQGHPIANNQSQRTVGSRGPATLENYQFLEKITHFDRERIPERVVHARGFVCYGELEVTGKIGDEPASNTPGPSCSSRPARRRRWPSASRP